MNSSTPILSLALCLALTACADQGAGGSGDGGSGGASVAVAPSGDSPLSSNTIIQGGGTTLAALLLDMETAFEESDFAGRRHVWEMHPSATGPAEAIETIEDVGYDGNGHYAIELVDAVSLPVGINERNFDMTFARSVDARWKSRDFRMRSRVLAAQSYSIMATGELPVVAGISCVTIEFRRNVPVSDRPSHYKVDVDPSTGVVLGWREFDVFGQTLVRSEYETFSYGADLSNMKLGSGAFDAVGLDLRSTSSLDQQAGFTVRLPDVLPIGYAWSEARKIELPADLTVDAESLLPGGEWIRLVATDGIETLSFAHAATKVPGVTAGASNPTGKEVLNVLTDGTWEIGFGAVSDMSFVIMGRVFATELRQVVESAL